MNEPNDRAGRPARQAPSESEWELPSGYKTQPCKHCGGLITFKYVGAGIVRCLDAEKSRATKSGRLMAPRLAIAAKEAGLSPGRQVPPIEPPGLASSPTTPSSLRLSATFVEWLMGFPRGWSLGLTDCDASVTPSSPSKQPPRSGSSSGD